MVKIIGLLPANTYAYRGSFECRNFGSNVWTQGSNQQLTETVMIDVVHESIKIKIDGCMDILILDTLGDFNLGDPVRLLLNIFMAVWGPNADYPVGQDQYANIFEWLD